MLGRFNPRTSVFSKTMSIVFICCLSAFGSIVSRTVLTASAADNKNGNAEQVGQQLRLPLITSSLDSMTPVSSLDTFVNLNAYGGPYVGADARTAYALEDSSNDGTMAGIAAGGTTYYVDCSAGNDANSGKSTATAWKSLAKASSVPLVAGDSLLFKRNCSWGGTLRADWKGTASQPILIGAYGTGNRPVIRDGTAYDIRITGSYLIFDNLKVSLSTPPDPDPNCKNQPRGRRVGFGFESSAGNNIVRNSEAMNLSIGISFADATHDNKIIYNTITDNNVVWTLTSTATEGATGILLHGNHQEIGRNYFARNQTICTYDGTLGGISIELYTATNSNIHHNISEGDRVFTELGSSDTKVASNNIFGYNLHVSSYSGDPYGARFVVTRGYGDAYGPVTGTKLYNNIVYFTGSGSKAVTCGYCGTGILAMKNNILWASEPFWSDKPATESNNIYWSNDGKPLLHWNGGGSMSPTSSVADPQFVNAPNGDLHLKATSPAVNRALMDTLVTTYYHYDLDRTLRPVGGDSDIGSYEYK